MIVPTIAAFKQALSSPSTHFVMLKQIEPVLQDGDIVVDHTYHAAECKVRFNGALYMMYMPFRYETTRRLAELETKMCHIDSPIICHNKIYYNEVLVSISMGTPIYCDIVMQRIPEGKSLAEIMDERSPEEIKAMVDKMAGELNRIGFMHNHLTNNNIIVGNDMRIYPIRYWYATLERRSVNQGEGLHQYIMDNDHSDYTTCRKATSLLSEEDRAEVYYEGLTHFTRHKRIGFKDMEGNEVIPPVYYAATHFLEGRAIVSKRLRKGVINKRGEIVVDIEYMDLKLDTSRHLFVGYKEGRRYTFDYNGKLVERVRCDAKFEGGGFLESEKRV